MKIKITNHQKILYGIILILLIILLIFIFRKVPIIPSTDREKELREWLDKAQQEKAQQHKTDSINSAIRQHEIDSMYIVNKELQDKIKSASKQYEKIIYKYRDASAAEIEQFFTERYLNGTNKD